MRPLPAESPSGARSGRLARTAILIFLLAFVLRAGLLFSPMIGPHFLRPFGEIGRVAVSLATHGTFADPYMIPTGPTAHPTPIYAGIQGWVIHILGPTAAAGYARGLLAILAFSTLYSLLPWLGWRLGLGAQAGAIAGFAGAIIPQQGMLEVIGGADQPFPGIALGLLSVAFLSRWTAPPAPTSRSLLLGLACGIALHLSPPLLTVLMGWVLFEMFWCKVGSRWGRLACLLLGVVVACIPWAWRNYGAFHEFLFIRGNFGLELRLANHDGAAADIDAALLRGAGIRHPSANLSEARMVLALGEAEYMRQARGEALAWIRRNPGKFLRLTMIRFFHFWCGPLRSPFIAVPTAGITILALLCLRRVLPGMTAPGRAVLVIPLAAFPLVYYLVSYVGHYRAPVEWLLLLLACAQVRHWAGGWIAGETPAAS